MDEVCDRFGAVAALFDSGYNIGAILGERDSVRWKIGVFPE
jgi:hypothetical protein